MPKEIVAKETIATDPCLMIVKAFRISNKRCGEAKRENNNTAFDEHVTKLRYLAAEADTRGFKIWVNENGKTGHTYAKDYKPTADADNDFAAYEAAAIARQNARNAMYAQIVERQSAAAEAAAATAETGEDDTDADNQPMPDNGDVPGL